MAVEGVGRYALLGETVDDAAGEAFDKTASLLGLPYPGGPALARLAQTGDPKRFAFPRPMIAGAGLDFSFSGLKTSALHCIRKHDLDERGRADVAASFQEAVVDVLCAKCLRALEATGLQQLVVAGGVGANAALRERLVRETARIGAQAFFPPLNLCTDNGAMIAFAASLRYREPPAGTGAFSVRPRWDLAAVG
jgi:N6-L-threonylcarbamoyladenine synthase